MRRVTVQLGNRYSDTDDTTPVVVTVEDDSAVGREWVETTARIAGDEAARVYGIISEPADEAADEEQGPPGQ